MPYVDRLRYPLAESFALRRTASGALNLRQNLATTDQSGHTRSPGVERVTSLPVESVGRSESPTTCRPPEFARVRIASKNQTDNFARRSCASICVRYNPPLAGGTGWGTCPLEADSSQGSNGRTGKLPRWWVPLPLCLFVANSIMGLSVLLARTPPRNGAGLIRRGSGACRSPRRPR